MYFPRVARQPINVLDMARSAVRAATAKSEKGYFGDPRRKQIAKITGYTKVGSGRCSGGFPILEQGALLISELFAVIRGNGPIEECYDADRII